MTGVRIWLTLGGIAVVGGLAVLVLVLSLWWRGCGGEDCFGVNWKTVTAEEIAGVDVHARDADGATPFKPVPHSVVDSHTAKFLNNRIINTL